MARTTALAWCVLALLSGLLIEPRFAFGQEQDRLAEALGGLGGERFELSADQVSYEQDRDLFEANGNVVIEQANGRTLSADWLLFNATTRVGVASGNVVIFDGSSRVRADFATVDLDTMVALAVHGELDSPDPGFTMRADTIEKTGVNTMRIEDGTFTTCRCRGADCRKNPWEITADRADVQLGGYAVVRDAKFRIRGVPVLWAPWLAFPVKTERQTGFLVPEVGISGRNGFEVTTPFFWAVNPALNLTIKPTWLAERGAKASLEAEYVLGEEAGGRAFFSGLPNDQDVSSGDVDTPFSERRWAYAIDHHQPFGNGLRLGLDLNGLSDNSYVVDFDDFERGARQAPFLESKGWLSYGRGAAYADVEASYLDDLQNPENLDRDDRFLHRLPDVRVSLLPRWLGPTPLQVAFDGRYTYFYQRDERKLQNGLTATRGLFFDTGRDGLFNAEEKNSAGTTTPGDEHLDDFATFLGTEGDGIFQEGELLADHGHRVDLFPRISAVRRLGWLETLTEGGVRQTLYHAANAGADTRTIWTGRVDLQAHFFRDISLFGRTLRHVMAPGAGFAYVSAPGQESNPLFIPRGAIEERRLTDGDLRTLLRAPSDRVEDARLLRVGVDNRFFAGSSEPGKPGRLVGEMRVSAGYDLLRSRARDLFVQTRYTPEEGFNLRADFGYDLKRTRVNEADIGFGWQSPHDRRLTPSGPDRRNQFNVSYRFLRDRIEQFEDFRFNRDFEDFDRDVDRIHQLTAGATWLISPRFDLETSGWMSLEGQSSGGRIGGVLHSKCNCWDLVTSFEKRLRPDDTRLLLSIRLTGLGLGARR